MFLKKFLEKLHGRTEYLRDNYDRETITAVVDCALIVVAIILFALIANEIGAAR